MMKAGVIRGGKASAIFNFPLRVNKNPLAISPPGVLLFAGCNPNGRYLPRTTSA